MGPSVNFPCKEKHGTGFSCPVFHLRQMVFGLIPCSSSSCSWSWEWVVVAGWITKLFTSATFASKENISNASIHLWASFWPPLISKVKIEAPPLGKYVSYKAWSGWSGREGWLTFSTWGWLAKYATTFLVFPPWRSTRKDKVSTPCKSRNALNGEIVAPVSRNKMARIFVTNAAGPTASVKEIPW